MDTTQTNTNSSLKPSSTISDTHFRQRYVRPMYKEFWHNDRVCYLMGYKRTESLFGAYIKWLSILMDKNVRYEFVLDTNGKLLGYVRLQAHPKYYMLSYAHIKGEQYKGVLDKYIPKFLTKPVYVRVLKHNTASQKLLERVGYRRLQHYISRDCYFYKEREVW